MEFIYGFAASKYCTKSKKKKFLESAWIVFCKVKSDELICVSVNPLMSLFIILSSFTKSSVFFKSDLTF